MYNWYLRHRDSNGTNLLNPRRVTQGYYVNHNTGNPVLFPTYAYSEFIPIIQNQTYQGYSSTSNVFRKVAFYDSFKQFISGIDGFVSTFTAPSGAYYVIVSFQSLSAGQEPEEMGVFLGAGSAFEYYFIKRQVYPIYKILNRDFEKQANYQFYREKLDGNLKLSRNDYDYVANLDFDQKMLLDIVDTTGVLPDYKGQFYKTDCKWDDDNKTVEVKTEPADDYTEVLGGLDKSFNIIQEAPELQEVILRRRPVIQVYIPGDTVLTNFLGGSYWEQEIQVDPIFDHNTLVNTYYFYNSKNIRIIPSSYAASLSTDVTGEYDSNRENTNGLYRILEETQSIYPGFTQHRYTVERISDGVDLYQTQWTNWQKPSINLVEFFGINGETGSFYFTEYRIYVRYYTDLLDVRGTSTYPVPSEDIVANNSNYRRVIGYNIDDFYIYDEFVTYPTKFGKVPEGTPDSGKYYKEFLVSVVTGLSNPSPVSSSNWRAVSLWFFTTLDIRYTEFIDGQDFMLRDSYPLHSVIQVLLREIGSHVTFDNTTDYSEFLYATINPLGGFTFLDFDGGTLLSDYVGNLSHFITPKSNIMVGAYDQPAQKSEVTLSQILNMLRDVYKCYWHIEDGKLRIEHVSWYQKGGTYSFTPNIGADLTQLIQPRNGKNWNFGQNKWEFDKENMPERFEYGWMDDVSIPFEGKPIQIKSSYVQLGRVEDMNVNGVTTDIDFIMANPQNISRDGLCLLGAVELDINTFNPLDYVAGEYINSADGTFLPDADSSRSKFIRVYPGQVLTFSGYGASFRFHTYSSNSTASWIAMKTGITTYTVEAGVNYIACLIALNDGTDYSDTFKITIDGVTEFRTPYIEANIGYNSEVIMQNGFLSWLYLHPKFHTYDLPSDEVNINGEDEFLYDNINQQKKQEVVYPATQTINPYQLVKTALGNGIVDKMSVSMESLMIKATIKHDTE